MLPTVQLSKKTSLPGWLSAKPRGTDTSLILFKICRTPGAGSVALSKFGNAATGLGPVRSTVWPQMFARPGERELPPSETLCQIRWKARCISFQEYSSAMGRPWGQLVG